MASSSKKRAKFISRIASSVYFLIIIFQIPLFRFPCRIGICTTPIEVASSQLIAYEVIPAAAVKALLYPGAIAKAVVKNKAIPTYQHLVKVCKFNHLEYVPKTTDLQHLEVLAGSYLSVAGALLGLLRPGRVSLCGVLLILWGLAREVVLVKLGIKHYSEDIQIQPMMSFAAVTAFLSIRRDVRKILRSSKARQRYK